MKTSWFKKLAAFGGISLMAILFTACDKDTTTSASCAFVVGNGNNGSDKLLHDVVLPGQSIDKGENERGEYVPCNSRNYLINDGEDRHIDGSLVGDRHTPIVAYTSTGVAIEIQVSAFWTLNQSEKAMRLFYTVCHKFTCASESDKAGTANSSTEGWNKMLGENFGPTLEAIGKTAANQVDDSIWQTQNQAQHKALADEMSRLFAEDIRSRLGFTEDLFCGSGNSQWDNPDKPGEGDFFCSPVRIEVTDVQVVQQNTDSSGQGVVDLNEQRLTNAEALYGDDAEYWLGLQDTIEKCKGIRATCVFNIGGGNSSPAVPIPSD